MQEVDIIESELALIDDSIIPRCVICLDILLGQMSNIGECGHVFHTKCLELLFDSNGYNNKCPIDRSINNNYQNSYKLYGADYEPVLKRLTTSLSNLRNDMIVKEYLLKENNEKLEKLTKKYEKKSFSYKELTIEKLAIANNLEDFENHLAAITKTGGDWKEQLRIIELIGREKQFQTKYRKLAILPTLSSTVTQILQKYKAQIEKEKSKSQSGDWSKVHPFTELSTMMSYQGQCKMENDIYTRWGWGKAIFCNGTYYEGNWVQGNKSGFGIEVKPSGSYKIGEWKNNKLDGLAQYSNRNGVSYEGDWANGVKEGKGTEIYNDSDGTTKYIGHFKNDKKNGNGIYTCKDYTYTGDFVNGEVNGTGNMSWSEGAKIYNGTWLNGKRHGQGIYIVKGKYKINGRFVDNQASGYGVVDFDGGFVYKGHLKNGKQHGKGVAYYPDGRVQEGIWSESKLVKLKENLGE